MHSYPFGQAELLKASRSITKVKQRLAWLYSDGRTVLSHFALQ